MHGFRNDSRGSYRNTVLTSRCEASFHTTCTTTHYEEYEFTSDTKAPRLIKIACAPPLSMTDTKSPFHSLLLYNYNTVTISPPYIGVFINSLILWHSREGDACIPYICPSSFWITFLRLSSYHAVYIVAHGCIRTLVKRVILKFHWHSNDYIYWKNL